MAWWTAVMLFQQRCVVGALLCLLWHELCRPLVVAQRPCVEGDWRFTFGVCRASAANGTGGFRNVYAYPARDGDNPATASPVCDPQDAGSYPNPRPQPMNLSCDHACPSGTHLGARMQPQTPGNSQTILEPVCELCPAGKFSLGGGLLVSGVAGDWLRRWPVELQTTCMYKQNGEWDFSSEQRSTDPSVQVEAPKVIAGHYQLASAPWNELLTTERIVTGQSTTLLGVLKRAPGDGYACTSEVHRGELPHVEPSFLKTVWLVLPGGCSPQEKATNAALSGANAVMLMNQGYQAVPFVPSGRIKDEEWPSIPLFGLGREDAEVFLVALNTSFVHVNISFASRPTSTPMPGMNNRTGDDSDEDLEIPGCSRWEADPSGRFVHSGDNKYHHELVSMLSMNIHLVRDGHVIFRYSVDAERDFDGLTFEVDWNQRLHLTSDQPEFTDFFVNLTAGPHLLRWSYNKDYGTTVGRDSARLQLIEVVGTSHADIQCRGCHSARTHSGAGAAHCNVCRRNEYLQAATEAELNFGSCESCPADHWSMPGAVGIAACHKRLPCGSKDVVDSYTQCENNKRYKQREWRQPVTCDQDHAQAGIVGPIGGEEEVPCEPCQPNEHRLDGSRCVPKFVQCEPHLHAELELVVNSWYSWPKNFSHELWILREDLADEDSGDYTDDGSDGHNWQLATTGDFVSASIPRTGPGAAPSPGPPSSSAGSESSQYGDALLHLDVDLVAEGSVRFFIDVMPHKAWEQEATLLIDNVAARASVVWSEGSLFQIAAPLTAGSHRLTWSWEYHTGAGGDSSEPQSEYYKLLNVTVLHAKGAGASRCEPCPPGEEVTEDGHGCKACTPGHRLDSDVHRCVECWQGSFSSAWGSTECLMCGLGTTSDSGAAYCRPLPELKTSIPFMEKLSINVSQGIKVAAENVEHLVHNAEEPLVFDVAGITKAWEEATAGVTGPFAVSGRQFVLGLFSPTSVPGVSTSGTAFAWELMQGHSRGGTSGGSRASCPGRNADDFESLGNSLAYVRGVYWGSTRGVSVGYRDGEPCGSSGKIRHAAIVFICDMEATFSGAPAHKDSLGMFQLNRLRLAPSTAEVPLTHEGTSSACSNVTLEWPTRAACPRCRREDYAPTVGLCGDDGYRDVTFAHQEACVGGATLPKPYREKCADPAQAKDKMKSIVAIVVLCAALMLIGLCAYACYLHKKYAKYVPEL